MKNYLDFGKCGAGRWKRYMYLDTEDFLLGSLLQRDPIPVKYETNLAKENEPYRLVMMKVRVKDESRFLQALAELPAKMLLCGFRDYETRGEELMRELKEALRADMDAHGRVSLPLGGTAKPELG